MIAGWGRRHSSLIIRTGSTKHSAVTGTMTAAGWATWANITLIPSSTSWARTTTARWKSKQTPRIKVLARGVCFDFHRAVVVLAQEVLDGIKVMLAHVAQPAAVIVPVTAECFVDPVRMIRLEWRRPQPAIIIQFGRHWLRDQVRPADPAEFPIKTGGSAEGDLEW